MPPELTDYIAIAMKEAWEKEKDYGRDAPTLSPFGDNQKSWYSVVEVALGVKIG